MQCPRCKSELFKNTIKEVNVQIEIDECQECGGIWLDKDEILPLEKVAKPTFWETRKIPKETDQLIGLNCPKCEETQLMKKAEHPRDHNVILDYCSNCSGIWLDKGELEAIQEENWLFILGRLF